MALQSPQVVVDDQFILAELSSQSTHTLAPSNSDSATCTSDSVHSANTFYQHTSHSNATGYSAVTDQSYIQGRDARHEPRQGATGNWAQDQSSLIDPRLFDGGLDVSSSGMMDPVHSHLPVQRISQGAYGYQVFRESQMPMPNNFHPAGSSNEAFGYQAFHDHQMPVPNSLQTAGNLQNTYGYQASRDNQMPVPNNFQPAGNPQGAYGYQAFHSHHMPVANNLQTGGNFHGGYDYEGLRHDQVPMLNNHPTTRNVRDVYDQQSVDENPRDMDGNVQVTGPPRVPYGYQDPNSHQMPNSIQAATHSNIPSAATRSCQSQTMPQTVRKRAGRGLGSAKPKDWSKAEMDKALELKASGHTAKQISKALETLGIGKRSQQAVYKKLFWVPK